MPGRRHGRRQRLAETEVSVVRSQRDAEILLPARQLDLREDRVRVDERAEGDVLVIVRVEDRRRDADQQIGRPRRGVLDPYDSGA